MNPRVNIRHLRQVVSMLDKVKDEVEAVNITGGTVTVMLSTDTAAKHLGDFLHLHDIMDAPNNYVGASGENYWYILAPERAAS